MSDREEVPSEAISNLSMEPLSQSESEAIAQIKEICHRIVKEMMPLQPTIGKLQDGAVRQTLYENVYQLTAQLETVKKQAIRYEKGDANRVL